MQSSGAAALRRSFSLYLAIGIAAIVLFVGDKSLDAATVVRIAERTSAARSLLIALWVTATLPAMRALLTAEQNIALRALPIPRRWIALWLGGFMVFAETPWLALWLRGGGVTKGFGAALTALALHACLVAGQRKASDAVLVALPCAAWLAPSSEASFEAAPIARIVVSAVVFMVALDRAWQRAPEIAPPKVRGHITGPPVRALMTSYGLVLLRAHTSALLRAFSMVAIALGWAGLAVINDEALRAGGWAAFRMLLAVFIPCTVFASATAAGPVLRAERAAEWVLAASGTSSTARRGATALLLGAAGGAIGLLGGTVLGVVFAEGGAGRLASMFAMTLTGAMLSALTEEAMRWSARDTGRDGARVVLSLMALIAVAEVSLWLAR
jgi:hypothetical protein